MSHLPPTLVGQRILRIYLNSGSFKLLGANMRVHIGMPVEMVTRKIRNFSGERRMIVYGYKF